MKIPQISKHKIMGLIKRQSEGNQSIVDFCRNHRIKPSKFYYWKRKLKIYTPKESENSKTTNKSPRTFIPISVPAVHNPDSSEKIELQFPSGMRACIPTSTGPAVVKAIIKACGR